MITKDNVGVFIKNRKGKPLEFASAVMKEQDSYLVSMQQSKISLADVCVAVGDRVLDGTLLGRPKDRNGCFVYSPTSGKVAAIIQKLSVFGDLVDHVLIVADKKNEKILFSKFEEVTRKNLLERLMSAGVMDMTGIPSYIKYVRKPIEKSKLYISCIDDDPYISCEEVNFRENLEQCVKGADLFCKLLNIHNVTFLFSSNQKSAIKAFKNYLKTSHNRFVSARVIDHVYPLSINEITLAVAGKLLDNAGRYNKGIYIESGIAAKQFYDGVFENTPVTSRIMTISGTGFIRKANFEVKNGTSLKAIMDFVGVNQKEHAYKMICGGVMSGIAQETDEATINITTPAVIFMTKLEFHDEKEYPCISCGKCVDVCPAKIMPYRIEEALACGDLDIAKKMGIHSCTSCGACSYVCPAKRYLTQRISDGRDKIMKNGGNK